MAAGTKLNGKVLAVDGQTGALPPMRGVATDCGMIRLPSLAVGFITVRQ